MIIDYHNFLGDFRKSNHEEKIPLKLILMFIYLIFGILVWLFLIKLSYFGEIFLLS